MLAAGFIIADEPGLVSCPDLSQFNSRLIFAARAHQLRKSTRPSLVSNNDAFSAKQMPGIDNPHGSPSCLIYISQQAISSCSDCTRCPVREGLHGWQSGQVPSRADGGIEAQIAVVMLDLGGAALAVAVIMHADHFAQFQAAFGLDNHFCVEQGYVSLCSKTIPSAQAVTDQHIFCIFSPLGFVVSAATLI